MLMNPWLELNVWWILKKMILQTNELLKNTT